MRNKTTEKERPKPQAIVRKEHFETGKRKKYINLQSPYHLTFPSRHHHIPNIDHKNLTTQNILSENAAAHQVPKLGKQNSVNTNSRGQCEIPRTPNQPNPTPPMAAAPPGSPRADPARPFQAGISRQPSTAKHPELRLTPLMSELYLTLQMHHPWIIRDKDLASCWHRLLLPLLTSLSTLSCSEQV